MEKLVYLMALSINYSPEFFTQAFFMLTLVFFNVHKERRIVWCKNKQQCGGKGLSRS